MWLYKLNILPFCILVFQPNGRNKCLALYSFVHWFLGASVVRWHNYYNCFNTLAANYISVFFFFIDLSFSTSFSFFCFMLCPWWHSTIRGFDFELRANPSRSWAPLLSPECKGGLGPLSSLSDMSNIFLDQIAICICCLYSETSWHF